MAGYVDLYLLPVPKKNLTAYKRLARRFGEIIGDHGAVAYREFVGEDLKPKGLPSFLSIVKIKPGEALLTSVVEFKSRKHRDQVLKRSFEDPRMQKMMCNDKPLFDMKRMHYGGFETFVSMKK